MSDSDKELINDDEINEKINENLKFNDDEEENVQQKQDTSKISKEQYIKLVEQSYLVSSLPLLKLLKITTGIDYTDFLFSDGNKVEKTAEIEFKRPDEKKQYVMYLDIVNKDYDLNFGKYGEDEKTKKPLVEQCLRLITFAQFLFNHIRDKNKELLEYHLILDNNSTLYLDPSQKKRIGIRFEPRKYIEN